MRPHGSLHRTSRTFVLRVLYSSLRCGAEAVPLLNLADTVVVRALLNDAISLVVAQQAPAAHPDFSFAEFAAIASTIAAMNGVMEGLRHVPLAHPFTVEVTPSSPSR